MDACVTKTTQAFQGRCIESCQAKNNQCSEKIFGVRREMTTPAVTTTQQSREAKDALAKKDVPAPRDVQPAAQPQVEPAEHPQVQVPAPRQAEAPAPAPQEAPAPRKPQAPARR
jgi:hypothetical protein